MLDLKKCLQVYFNSFKQSVLHKPIALAMFVLMIIVATIACGFSSRLMIGEVEQEIYPNTANIECEQDADYVAIGDYMRSIEEDYFDYYKNYGIIRASAIDVEATFKDKSVQMDIVDVNFEVFKNKFTDISIESGQKIMYANDIFCDLLGCGSGDYINFFGTEFLIVGVEKNEYYEIRNIITIPYKVQLASGDINNTNEQSILRIDYLDFYGLKKNFTKNIYEDLKKVGVKQGKEYISSALFQDLFMLICFLIASSLSIISVTNYWQSVNARKYNIYKMIGASPKAVTGIMLFETGVVAIVAVAIGLLIDYLISLFVSIGSISKLLWLHYLILFIATLFAVMVVVTIKTIKMAKRLPMQQPIKPKRKEKKNEKN